MTKQRQLEQKVQILEQENQQFKQTLDRYESKFTDISIQLKTPNAQTAIKMRWIHVQAI